MYVNRQMASSVDFYLFVEFIFDFKGQSKGSIALECYVDMFYHLGNYQKEILSRSKFCSFLSQLKKIQFIFSSILLLSVGNEIMR